AKESVVEPDFNRNSMSNAHPMQCAFYLYARGIGSAAAFRNVGAVDFGDLTFSVFDDFVTTDDVCAFQSYHLTGSKSEVLPWRVLHEVFAFNVNLAAKRDFAFGNGFGHRIVFTFHHLHLVLLVVGDNNFDGVKYDHPSERDFVQVFPYAVFKQTDIDQVLTSRHANLIAELTDAFRSITTTAHAAYRGHSGVVPAAYVALVDQL